MLNVIELPFGCPSEQNGYNPFTKDLVLQQGMVFHGTSEDRAQSIIREGFKPTGELTSSSFTTSKGLALRYACSKRHATFRGAVLAVLFQNLKLRGIRNEGQCIYLDDHSIQPEFIAVCYIPNSYQHI